MGKEDDRCIAKREVVVDTWQVSQTRCEKTRVRMGLVQNGPANEMGDGRGHEAVT